MKNERRQPKVFPTHALTSCLEALQGSSSSFNEIIACLWFNVFLGQNCLANEITHAFHMARIFISKVNNKNLLTRIYCS